MHGGEITFIDGNEIKLNMKKILFLITLVTSLGLKAQTLTTEAVFDTAYYYDIMDVTHYFYEFHDAKNNKLEFIEISNVPFDFIPLQFSLLNKTATSAFGEGFGKINTSLKNKLFRISYENSQYMSGDFQKIDCKFIKSASEMQAGNSVSQSSIDFEKFLSGFSEISAFPINGERLQELEASETLDTALCKLFISNITLEIINNDVAGLQITPEVCQVVKPVCKFRIRGTHWGVIVCDNSCPARSLLIVYDKVGEAKSVFTYDFAYRGDVGTESSISEDFIINSKHFSIREAPVSFTYKINMDGVIVK
jgi:hypothetical protein